jgi:excisionase family DNA binding protein
MNRKQNAVLITKEAFGDLRISRPTYVKYLQTGRIQAIKVGKGWRVLKSELKEFGGSQKIWLKKIWKKHIVDDYPYDDEM